MKITLVGPGLSPIPPTGWGAVEILVWEMNLSYQKLGHDVQIVNTTDLNDALKEINLFNPDFVHIQYDDYIVLYPHLKFPTAITTHYGYLGRPQLIGGYWQKLAYFPMIQPNIFALSQEIATFYSNLGIPKEKIFVTPNGVNAENFKISDCPEHSDKSLYLAKVVDRKRQYMFQDISSLYYAGNIEDDRFNTTKNYLGEWDKKDLYNNLTHFANLVLLSDGEAHALVCMEALSAGLGLVISEWASANLDTNKEFITVIPEDKINNINFIDEKIRENREVSLKNRKNIIEYSKQFYWDITLQKYHLPFMEKIIRGQK